MLRMASCSAVARAAFENTGSAKAIIALRAEDACEPARRILRLATEGKTATACERISQFISLRLLPFGFLVTRSCGGRPVKAPLVMIDSRFLAASLSANAPNVA